jgi:hypothetical protein
MRDTRGEAASAGSEWRSKHESRPFAAALRWRPWPETLQNAAVRCHRSVPSAPPASAGPSRAPRLPQSPAPTRPRIMPRRASRTPRAKFFLGSRLEALSRRGMPSAGRLPAEDSGRRPPLPREERPSHPCASGHTPGYPREAAAPPPAIAPAHPCALTSHATSGTRQARDQAPKQSARQTRGG